MIIHKPVFIVKFKGCAHCIFASLSFSQKESTCENRKNAFHFTPKTFFILEKIKVRNFKYANFMMLSNA